MAKQKLKKQYFDKGTSFSSEILKTILKVQKTKTVND
jgi:hypothetical protein